MRIAFLDAKGDVVSQMPDLSASRLYMFVHDKTNNSRNVVELTREGSEYTGTVNGLYDQNGNTNNGNLYPLDPSHNYEMALFSNGCNAYYHNQYWVDTNNSDRLLFLQDGTVLGGRYLLELPEQLSERLSPVSAGYEYTAVATAFRAGGAESYASILGDAVNFGIVTEYFDLPGGDAESNIAAFKGRCLAQTGSDLTNDEEQTIILAEIADSFKISGYRAYVKIPEGEASKLVESGITGGHLTIDTSQTKAELTAEVRAMLDYTKAQSDTLTAKQANAAIMPDGSRYCLDLSGRGAGTYYVTVSDSAFDQIMSQASKFRIIKEDNQTVVFNIAKSGSLTMQKFDIQTDGSLQGADSFLDIERPATRTIIWNMPNAQQVYINGSVTGIVLAHQAEVFVGNTSSGWLISKKVTIGSGEWHNVYHNIEKLSDAVILRAAKMINHAASPVSGFTFSLDYKKGNDWVRAGTAKNVLSAISFSKLPCLTFSEDTFVQTGEKTGADGKKYKYGDYYYRITETAGDSDSTGNHYIMDTRSYYAKVTVTEVTVHVNSQPAVKRLSYRASVPQYFFDEACTQPIPENTLSTFDNISLVKTEIPVSKTWQDGDNVNGHRPDKIILHLLADEAEVQTAELTPDAKGEWNYRFTDLPKYKNDNGTVRLIEYTVEEEAVDHYNLTDNTVETDEHGNTSISLVNTESNDSYMLPATGGEGTRRIYLISITLIALAGAGLIMIRRRRERTR